MNIGIVAAAEQTAVSRVGKRKAQRLPKILSEREVRALMAAPNLECPTGLRDRCLMQLMHRCGMRITEACGVRLGDVDWETGHIKIVAETAKYSKERTVYADPRTVDLLGRWRSERGRHTRTRKDEAPLFIAVRKGVRGKQVTTDSIYKMTRRRMERVGISREKAHPHVLRHTFASDMLSRGRTLAEIQQMMGHASVQTTSIYLHVNDPRLAEHVQAIDWGY